MSIYEQLGRYSTPKWSGRGVILDIDETGVAVKFRSQTLKVARCCVPKRYEPMDVVNVDFVCCPRDARVQDAWRNLIGEGGASGDFQPGRGYGLAGLYWPPSVLAVACSVARREDGVPSLFRGTASLPWAIPWPGLPPFV